MRRLPLAACVVAFGLASSLLSSPATAQTDGFPTISSRNYTGGSAKLTVTGSTTFTAEIDLNAPASISADGSTWLQFGASGAAEPNLLITYGETKEVGIIVGKGKFAATGVITPGEKSECSGKVSVTAALITGDYACKGVTSKEASGGMGKVDIQVSFTAKS